MSELGKFTIEEKKLADQELAKVFVEYGFGFTTGKIAIEKKFGKKLTAVGYNNIMTTIVRATFRSLQEFIHSSCGKQITPVRHEEEKVIRSAMIQCRKWMDKLMLQTFFKFVTKSFRLKDGKIQILPKEALRLYSQLKHLIENKNNTSKIIKEKKKQKQSATDQASFQYMLKNLPKREDQEENDQAQTQKKNKYLLKADQPEETKQKDEEVSEQKDDSQLDQGYFDDLDVSENSEEKKEESEKSEEEG